MVRLFLLALILTLAPVRAEPGSCCGQGSCLTCQEACSLCAIQSVDLPQASPLVLPLPGARLALAGPQARLIEIPSVGAYREARCPLFPLSRGRAPPRALGV